MIVKIIIILIPLIAALRYLKKLCDNPYTLTMIFGKKGSGKTTLLTKLAIKYKKLGYTIFSNVEIFGAEELNINDLGIKQFPINSVILIDEVSLLWSNRDFKNFPKHIEKYFRLQRHYKHIVFLFSQSFDIDKKIRDLCDQMYLLKNLGGWLSIAMKIRKTPTIHTGQLDENGKKTSEGYISEDYSYYFPTQWIFTFIPRYFKFFNSFELENMPKLTNRKLYKFKNEPYLYQLTDNGYYIKDLINDKIKSLKKTYKVNKHSFKIKELQYFNQILGYPTTYPNI